MGAEVDQNQNFRPGLGMFLFREDNPSIVTDGTGMESSQLTAQVVGLQAGVVEIGRHPAERGFNGGLQRGIFPGQPAKGPLKPRREDKFVHGSFAGRA